MAGTLVHLPPLIRRLLEPRFYPHPTQRPIGLVETHISYLLLTGSFVYKVKKPVNLGFLDFSTLRQREHFCREELRLNQRGAPQLYLDVIPITHKTNEFDSFELGGDGPTVEYALRMRQFPENARFDQMLDRGLLDEALIERLAGRVADYHGASPTTQHITSFGRPQTVGRIINDNYGHTARFVGGPQTAEQLVQTRAFTDERLTAHCDLMNARADQGCVRECHGDLHLGNIALWEEKILLFDCIEFDEALRCIDVMQDAAFVAIDLDARGRGDLSALFLNAYAELTGDWQGLALTPLYLSRHAYVRAKVHSLISESKCDEGDKESELRTASGYYRLAWQYGRPRTGRLILITGLPGSGKTTVARQLLAYLGKGSADSGALLARLAHIRSDAVRKHLAGIALQARGGEALYGAENTARTYARLIGLGIFLARHGFVVLLDAAFARQAQRAAAIDAARVADIPLRIVHCQAPSELIHQRLAARRGDVSDATPDVFEFVHKAFDPLSQAEWSRAQAVDTSLAVSPASIDI